MKEIRLVFMGPPGVGKGTQAARIAEALSIPHIATGDMFRRAIREETPMGRKAKPFVDEGKYVPDEIVNGIVEERLSEEDCARGFVLDGFPRTLEQARALEEILKSRGKQIDLVIDLQVGDDEILSRLTGRRVCPQCGATYHIRHAPPQQADRCDRCGGTLIQRSDDEERTVRKRLEVYRQETTPLISFYRERGLLAEIPGEGSMDEVTERIQNVLQRRGNGVAGHS